MRDQKAKDAKSAITVQWAPGSKAITIGGQWQRQESGDIRAEYTPDELAMCLKVAAELGFLGKDINPKAIFESVLSTIEE